jgi:hypothetical protein
MANRVVHFEIGAQDKKRASDFYSKAFGWKMDPQSEEMGGYIVVTTGDPKIPGGINGGIYQDEKKTVNAYRCVIGVDDINKAIADVKSAGGKVFSDNKTPDGKELGEVMDIPTIGKWAKCQDTEGNFFSLLQPSMEMMKDKE